MIESHKTVQLDDGIKVHVIKSEKFKTVLVGAFFRRNLTKEEAVMNTLLTRLLERSTKEQPKAEDFNAELEELYGTILACDVSKFGEQHILQFKVQFAHPKFVHDQDLFDDEFKLISDILLRPNVQGGRFNDDYFRQEVKSLNQEIQTLSNDKMIYALERCIETMCDDEVYKIHEYGDLETLATVTNEKLYAHYQSLIRQSPIEICIIGDVDEDKMINLCKKHFVFEREALIDIVPTVTDKKVDEVKYVTEKFPINQGKITLGYRTNISPSDPLYYASVVYSGILGGGASSKLFLHLREKEGLCYYIFSKIDKYKAIMLISAGIEFENYEKTLALIHENTDKMKNGEITDNEISIAKKAMISNVRSISDFQNSYTNYFYEQLLVGKSVDIDAIVEKIKGVTIEEVVAVANKITLDTVSFMTKEGDDEISKDS